MDVKKKYTRTLQLKTFSKHGECDQYCIKVHGHF